jgi:hypothetical protein
MGFVACARWHYADKGLQSLPAHDTVMAGWMGVLALSHLPECCVVHGRQEEQSLDVHQVRQRCQPRINAEPERNEALESTTRKLAGP